jgi:hypothetical protein
VREEETGEVGEWRRPLGKGLHIRKQKDDIELDVQEIEYDGLEWIHLAQNRVR